jgi:hypothetical protein
MIQYFWGLFLAHEVSIMAGLAANLFGTASLRIADSRFSGPFFQNVDIPLVFSSDRRSVSMTSLELAPVGPFQTPIGPNTISITKTSGGVGAFSLGAGEIFVPVTLRFDHSIALIGGSSLSPNMTTGATSSSTATFNSTGSNLSPLDGSVVLVGAAKFVGGFLGGTNCLVTLSGTVTPSPFVTDLFTPPVYAQGSPGNGIGGYDLADPADRAFAFDYDHSGKLDHIALYRPGTGTMWILKNEGGAFSAVYAQGSPGNGIGGYDLADPADRALAFDYDHSGKLDHIALYRPGTGTMWILKNEGGAFSAVYAQGSPGNGIGGYDLADPADRALAFDYDHSGKLDHIALYRPGTGTMWILKNEGGAFSAVYAQGSPGNGIGGYDLADPADQSFAFDYDHSGKLDHIALYRPGTGTMWILKNDGGAFSAEVAEGSPGVGIGGYDLAEPMDRAFAFDYNHSGKPDHIALYRPGTGTMWILKHY